MENEVHVKAPKGWRKIADFLKGIGGFFRDLTSSEGEEKNPRTEAIEEEVREIEAQEEGKRRKNLEKMIEIPIKIPDKIKLDGDIKKQKSIKRRMPKNINESIKDNVLEQNTNIKGNDGRSIGD